MAIINYRLLPIKAHFFFFMAAMGPILPQINVFGKQLGISPDVMGFVTSVLPILYVLAKPIVGYLIDYFPNMRKMIFMTILLTMILCYAGFLFVPTTPAHRVPIREVYSVNGQSSIASCETIATSHQCTDYRAVDCSIDDDTIHNNFTGLLGLSDTSSHHTLCRLIPACSSAACDVANSSGFTKIECTPTSGIENNCIYGTSTFWSFILLMCIGTIGFNVANSVSDATCFDMLGDKTMKYGAQRVWGTIGFGVTALASGIIVHLYQNDVGNGQWPAIAPAIIIMLVFGFFDIISIKWLHLPQFSNEGDTILSKVLDLLSQKSIAIFLVFATLAGILDSFIIYYMFWHLEEVAERTGYMESIKLIEGCVVAAECLGGEILFFLVSGKILKRIGYVHCLSFCFLMYSIRLGLISMIPNPWWLVLVEFFMQGCSYALCYTCIVAYASAVAPPGTTATVQGLVAGMDDGAGFSLGSIIGGQMYKRFGGVLSFRIFSIGALVICVAHIFLRPAEKEKIKTAENGQRQMEVIALKKMTDGNLSEAEPFQQKITANEYSKC